MESTDNGRKNTAFGTAFSGKARYKFPVYGRQPFPDNIEQDVAYKNDKTIGCCPQQIFDKYF
jgi:hypothetical protein